MTKRASPPTAWRGREEYSRARLLRLRPALALGGHYFHVYSGVPPWCQCLHCYVSIPAWALKEHMWEQFGLARLCPDLFAALLPGVEVNNQQRDGNTNANDKTVKNRGVQHDADTD